MGPEAIFGQIFTLLIRYRLVSAFLGAAGFPLGLSVIKWSIAFPSPLRERVLLIPVALMWASAVLFIVPASSLLPVPLNIAERQGADDCDQKGSGSI
jgi:hypothetical protein